MKLYLPYVFCCLWADKGRKGRLKRTSEDFTPSFHFKRNVLTWGAVSLDQKSCHRSDPYIDMCVSTFQFKLQWYNPTSMNVFLLKNTPTILYYWIIMLLM